MEGEQAYRRLVPRPHVAQKRLLLVAFAATAAVLLPASALAAPGDINASLVSNINPIPGFGGDSSPSRLVNAGGTILFSAIDDTHGRELWKSDGTAAGTIRLSDINLSGDGLASSTDLVNVNGTVFFPGYDGTDTELYKEEPPYTAPPTKIEINPSGSSGPQNLANFNGTLFFAATDGSSAGYELWKSTGGTVASGSTAMVADINTTAGEPSFPEQLTPVGNTLFFVATDGNDGDDRELWKTDGTVGNKTELEINPTADEGSDPFDLTNVGGTLFLAADDGGTTVGRELWRIGESDTSATPIDIRPGTAGSDPEQFGVFGGTVFFPADDGSTGVELWKSNGNTVASGGTARVADINPGPGDSFPEDPFAYNGLMFFGAADATHGTELWKTNGGPLGAGTEMVADINSGPPSSSPTSPIIANGAVWFRAATAGAGNELWKFDGAVLKTFDIRPGPADSNPDDFAASNGVLFFSANDGTSNGIELWKATIEPAGPAGSAVPAGTALPSNTFTVGQLKGRRLTLKVDSAGTAVVDDKGSQGAGRANESAAKNLLKPSSGSGGPGKIVVRLKLTRRAKATLKDRGKLKVKAQITFTPTGGTASTRIAKLKLKKNLAQ